MLSLYCRLKTINISITCSNHAYYVLYDSNDQCFLGSNRLTNDALQRACYVVRFLFADRYDIRNSYYRMYGRFALMAASEVHMN